MLRFGSVHVDVDAREVWMDGTVTHLEPQAFDLLTYLITHRDRVVPKSELLDEVWGDQFVSESALTTRIKEIRRATGDDGRTQRVVKNVRGRGYRFVAIPTESTAAAPDPTDRPQRRVPPPPSTPSIGLVDHIAHLAELSAERRLVTIVGPGGVGKTRLAGEVGRAVAGRHALGARVVELARISDAAALGPTVRRALDRSEEVASVDIEGSGAIDALVVLDNCEHVIDAVADHIPTLLSGGDALRILATSREPLGVPGEHRVYMSPLATDGADSAAMSLFVERANDVGVDVDPADPRAQAIVDHLDGIPLALEMGAARLATTGLADLETEVERRVGSLRAGLRGVPERHSTLRNVLAWSEALLTSEQRRTLAEFSAFVGPVEASDLPATVSASDPVGAVCALAERSLVTVDTGSDGHARYGSLQTIRQFGRERLRKQGRDDAVRRRHAEWFTKAAEAAAALYDTEQQLTAGARIDAIFDELRVAHRWARDRDPPLAIRLSAALYETAVQQLRLEVFDWDAALAETLDPDTPGAPQLFGEFAMGLTMVGRIEEGRTWAERAVAASADDRDVWAAFAALADIHLYTGDLAEALATAQRFVEVVGNDGSGTKMAIARCNVALSLAYLGRVEEALDEIPADFGEKASPTARAWLAYGRGEVLLDTDPEAALDELDRSIELAESVGGHLLSGIAHVSAASLRTRTGHAEDAIVPLARTLERLADRGNTTHLLTTLRNLPTLLTRLGEWHPAARMLGGLSTATISPTYGDEAERLVIAETATRTALGADEFDGAFAQGVGRPLDHTARDSIDILRHLAERLDSAGGQ